MRARLLTTATLTAAGLLLAGCGGEDTASSAPTAASSAPVDGGSSGGAPEAPTAAAGSLVFPDDFGLPSLTVPEDAQVVSYTVTDDLSFDVRGLADTPAVLDSVQAELAAAGFQVDRTDGGGLGISITASKEGAGTVLVQQTAEDAVTVIGQPPA